MNKDNKGDVPCVTRGLIEGRTWPWRGLMGQWLWGHISPESNVSTTADSLQL